MPLGSLPPLEEGDFYLSQKDIKFSQNNIILKEAIVVKAIVGIVPLDMIQS